MSAVNPDRTPAAAARLTRALDLLKRRKSDDAAHQGATISELCRLAGVSRTPYIDIIRECSPSCAGSKGAPHILSDSGRCPLGLQINRTCKISLRSWPLWSITTTPPTVRRARCSIVVIDNFLNSDAS
jgi:hypothetical protein